MNELEKYKCFKKIEKIVGWCSIVLIVISIISIISIIIYGFSKVCNCYEILVDGLVLGLLISGIGLFLTVMLCSLIVLSESD
jgi:hypothetical protein